jgi:diketogulonate reductase-like aldo/keto reductase
VIAKAVTSNLSLDRSSFFLTTKIWDCTAEDTVETILPVLQDAVRKMHPVNNNPYVDLFLIHQPIAGPEGRLKLWKALIEVVLRWSICMAFL